MIKFFRKIRQKLLVENRFNKYLIYAIGEIVLVVIGILIALQINNWNERKKDRDFEIKMLKELKVALVNDFGHYIRMTQRVRRADSSAVKLIQYYHNKVSLHDSMYPILRILRTGIQWQQNYGPYQGIKSAGINKISNDSLRQSLVNFYDFNYPKDLELLKWYDKDYDRQLDRFHSFRNEPYTRLNSKDSIIVIREYSEDILENPDFLLLLRDFKFRTTRTMASLNNTIEDIRELLVQLNEELENSNPSD